MSFSSKRRRSAARLLAFALMTSLVMALMGLAPALAAGGGCTMPRDLAAMKQTLLTQLNAERTRRGLHPLQMDPALDKAAQGHACDNAKRLSISHEGSNGSKLQNRLRRSGYDYRTASENTGRGFATPERAVEWWMASPYHKKNMLMRDTRDIGIGIAISAAPDSRLHWVIDMGLSD